MTWHMTWLDILHYMKYVIWHDIDMKKHDILHVIFNWHNLWHDMTHDMTLHMTWYDIRHDMMYDMTWQDMILHDKWHMKYDICHMSYEVATIFLVIHPAENSIEINGNMNSFLKVAILCLTLVSKLEIFAKIKPSEKWFQMFIFLCFNPRNLYLYLSPF